MRPLAPRFRIRQDRVQLGARHPIRIHGNFLQKDYPAHDHEFAELCLVEAGHAEHVTAAGNRPLSAGSMIVVMPGQAHAFRRAREFRVTNIYYLSEWIMRDFRSFADGGSVFPLFLFESVFGRPAWPTIPQFVLSEIERREARRDLQEIQEELDRAAPSAFFLRATFSRFLYRTARAFERSADFPRWEISGVVRHLLENMEKSLSGGGEFSLDAALSGIRVSERHAARLFRSSVGSSIWEYYQRRRIQAACQLLLDPQRPITEIAHELGFADGAHFTRSFRRERGRSPREYRRIFGLRPGAFSARKK